MEEATYNLDPAFKKESVYMQLGRIIDSESVRDVVPAHKFKPVDSVITEEGKRFKVKPREAMFMREMIVKVPTVDRADLLKKIQTSEGFKEFRDVMKQMMTKKK